MVTREETYPLIVIIGETSSGKSSLAMALAKKFSGEIISADSRSLYRGMDIGTSKPSTSDQAHIPHHLIDVSTPDSPLTASDFQTLANKAINKVSKKSKLPILVGGSGLYVDSVIFNYKFGGPRDESVRKENLGLSVNELQKKLLLLGLDKPFNHKNPRHLVRRLESGNNNVAINSTLRPNTLIIGIQIDNNKLKDNISQRLNNMFKAGLEKEAVRLGRRYGWSVEPLKTIGYREFEAYDSGLQTIEETKNLIELHTISLARRQRTWFRRNKNIHWVEKQREAVELVTTFLNK